MHGPANRDLAGEPLFSIQACNVVLCCTLAWLQFSSRSKASSRFAVHRTAPLTHLYCFPWYSKEFPVRSIFRCRVTGDCCGPQTVVARLNTDCRASSTIGPVVDVECSSKFKPRPRFRKSRKLLSRSCVLPLPHNMQAGLAQGLQCRTTVPFEGGTMLAEVYRTLHITLVRVLSHHACRVIKHIWSPDSAPSSGSFASGT